MASFNHRQGRCFACGIPGPPDRTKNFLCGDCAHPEKIIHVCARCHQRTDLKPESATIRTLQEYQPALPDHPGITIVAEMCDTCRKPTESFGRIDFYVLRPSDYH